MSRDARSLASTPVVDHAGADRATGLARSSPRPHGSVDSEDRFAYVTRSACSAARRRSDRVEAGTCALRWIASRASAGFTSRPRSASITSAVSGAGAAVVRIATLIVGAATFAEAPPDGAGGRAASLRRCTSMNARPKRRSAACWFMTGAGVHAPPLAALTPRRRRRATRQPRRRPAGAVRDRAQGASTTAGGRTSRRTGAATVVVPRGVRRWLGPAGLASSTSASSRSNATRGGVPTRVCRGSVAASSTTSRRALLAARDDRMTDRGQASTAGVSRRGHPPPAIGNPADREAIAPTLALAPAVQ